MTNEHRKTDVLIVGAGAAGMLAAAHCAADGNHTLVVDKNNLPGKKILITGKGRCNVTNDCDEDTVLKNTLRGNKFLYSALYGFSPRNTMAYFENAGVSLKTERGNRVFPCSDQAEDIRSALERNMRSAGAHYITGRITAIRLDECGHVCGAKTENGKIIDCTAMLIATGGLSYPTTGSTGDGYALARAMGHTIVATAPSLVSLKSGDTDIPLLQGLSLRNVVLSLWEEGKKKPVYKEMGEMLFTHYGVSGPLVLSASAYMKEDKGYSISVDLKPGLSDEKLDARILRDFEERKNSHFSNALDHLLPRKLIPVVIARCGIAPTAQVNSITREQRQQLVRILRKFTVNIAGKRPVSEAVITRGGVSLKEVDPRTMGSKLVPGLFFAGEVLDVDGFTGGFNLQIAFSTAVAAAKGMEAYLRGE